MKPPAFTYVRAASLHDAVAFLAQHGEDAKIIAGGQSLIPLLNLRLARPTVLVDVSTVAELQRIRVDGQVLSIGAAVRQRTAETSPAVAAVAPGVTKAVAHIGHLQIRNRGTVGGSLAHADPVAELPLMAVALGADLVARSAGGTRTIPAGAFFTGPFTTALEPDEVLVELVVPAGRRRVSLHEETRRTGDFALAAAAGWVELDESSSTVTAAGVAVCGTEGTAVALPEVADSLLGRRLTPALARRAGEATSEVLHVSEGLPDRAYRRHLAGVLVSRVFSELAA